MPYQPPSSIIPGFRRSENYGPPSGSPVCGISPGMLFGMYLSHSVHLQEMAAKLPLEVRLTSIARRFRRFLNNLAFDPRT